MNRHAETRRLPRRIEIERFQPEKTGVRTQINSVVPTNAAEDRFVVSEHGHRGRPAQPLIRVDDLSHRRSVVHRIRVANHIEHLQNLRRDKPGVPFAPAFVKCPGGRTAVVPFQIIPSDSLCPQIRSLVPMVHVQANRLELRDGEARFLDIFRGQPLRARSLAVKIQTVFARKRMIVLQVDPV